jgi:hypothetical protein
MWLSVTLATEMNSPPRLLAFWIVPPEPAVPVPLTVNAPAPVLFRLMPFVPPFAEMLRNVMPLGPIVVLATLSAVPVVVVIVLTRAPAAGLHGFSSQTLTVPPPVAVNAGLAPVESTNPPENVMVAPVLLVSEMPLPSPSLPSVMAPAKLLVPPVVPLIDTSAPTSSVIVPL